MSGVWFQGLKKFGVEGGATFDDTSLVRGEVPWHHVA